MRTLRRDLSSFRQLCSRQPGLVIVLLAALAVTVHANSLANDAWHPCQATAPDLAVETLAPASYLPVVDGDGFQLGGVSLRSHLFLSRGDGRQPEGVTGARVSAEIFAVLGVKPVLGRNYFLPRESGADGAPVVLISTRMWKRHFDGRLSALGDVMILNGRAHTVVGILPKNLDAQSLGLFEGVDLWLPVGQLVTPAPSGGDRSFIAG